MIVDAASKTLKRSWFWYSIAASLCWAAWAFTARLGSKEIPPATMQFVSAFGFLLVSLVMVAVQRPQLKQSLRGNSYALISGLLLGLGGIALYGAYRAGDNASVVTATTSLYPVATVLLAVTFLRENGCTVKELPPELFPGMGHSAFAFDPDGHAVQLYAYMEQVGWDGRPRPANLRPEIKLGEWPDTVPALPDSYGGEPFLGPWG